MPIFSSIAQFIAPRGLKFPDPTPGALYKEFSIVNLPKNFILRAAGYVVYDVFVNGNRILSGPMRSLPGKLFCDEIDIAPFVRTGKNSLAVVILPHNGSLSRAKSAPAGFICEIAQLGLVSDQSWLGCRAEWYGYSDEVLSVSLFPQEHFNFSVCPDGWMTGEKLDLFCPVEIVDSGLKVFGKRPTAIPTENAIEPPLVFSGHDDRHIGEISSNLRYNFSNTHIISCSGEPEILNADRNLVTFDVGRTRMVQPAISVSDFKGSGRIELYYSHKITDRPDCSVGFGHENEGFVDSVTPREGQRSFDFDPLYPRGCRFVTVRLAGNASCRLKVRFRTVDYPYAEPRELNTADETLQSIWRMCTNNIYSATTDVLVDTCQRENALWTLDACVTGRAAFDTFGDREMWRANLALILDSIDETGHPKSIAVSDIKHSLFDQELFFVINLLDYTKSTGDKSLAIEHYAQIIAFMKLMNSGITDENLYSHPKECWHFIDWAEIDKRPYSLPINCLLILAAEASVELAGIAGSDELRQIAQSIILRVRPNLERFFDKNRWCFICRIEPKIALEYNDFLFSESDKNTPDGLHANIFALAARAGTPEMRAKTVEFLKRKLSENPDGNKWKQFGPEWAGFFLKTLVENGMQAEADALLLEKFAPFVEIGAPTVGETLWAEKYNSAHGWGSSANSYLAARYGVREKLQKNFEKFSKTP